MECREPMFYVMLCQRRRQRTSNTPALGQRLALAGCDLIFFFIFLFIKIRQIHSIHYSVQ